MFEILLSSLCFALPDLVHTYGTLEALSKKEKREKRNRHEASPTTKPAVRPIQTNGPCGAVGASMLSTHRVGNLHIILIANGDTMAFFFYPKVYAILGAFLTSPSKIKAQSI